MSYKDYLKRNKFIEKNNLSSYKDLLQSENWKILKKKLRENYQNYENCIFCNRQTTQIHHIYYTRAFFGLISRLKISDARLPKKLIKHLIPVCGNCHQNIHCIEHSEGITIYRATKKYAKLCDSTKKLRVFKWKKKTLDIISN